MNSKYMFADEPRLVVGHTLHRIRALRDVGVYAKTGEFGGWVESEGNLSETGDAWVAGKAQSVRISAGIW